MVELRAFLAVAPSTEARLALIDQLDELDTPGKLVPPANWHITLRFLGDIDEVTSERFQSMIDQSDLAAPFRVSIDRIGAFPSPSKATVVFAGVAHGEGNLHRLAETADSAAEASGVAPEERPYSPHLTISRIRPPVDARALVGDAQLDVAWKVDRLTLFQSVPGRGGIKYETLETFDLNG